MKRGKRRKGEGGRGEEEREGHVFLHFGWSLGEQLPDRIGRQLGR